MTQTIPPYIHSFHRPGGACDPSCDPCCTNDRPEWRAARQRTPEEDRAVSEAYARRADAIEAELRETGRLITFEEAGVRLRASLFDHGDGDGLEMIHGSIL